MAIDTQETKQYAELSDYQREVVDAVRSLAVEGLHRVWENIEDHCYKSAENDLTEFHRIMGFAESLDYFPCISKRRLHFFADELNKQISKELYTDCTYG